MPPSRSHLRQTLPAARAVAIFTERGVAVDVKPGLDKDELANIIGEYDGLAIRSNTKVTASCSKRRRGSRWSGAPASASTTSTSPPPPRAASS